MKRTCNNCKALLEKSRVECICSLGKKIIATEKLYGCISTGYKPMEECPKPMTNLEYCKYTASLLKAYK